MTRGGWRTHNDVAVAVGFNPAFELRELRIGQKLSPSVQVENRLRFVLREFDCQCWHVAKLPSGRSLRQVGNPNLPKPAKPSEKLGAARTRCHCCPPQWPRRYQGGLPVRCSGWSRRHAALGVGRGRAEQQQTAGRDADSTGVARSVPKAREFTMRPRVTTPW